VFLVSSFAVRLTGSYIFRISYHISYRRRDFDVLSFGVINIDRSADCRRETACTIRFYLRSRSGTELPLTTDSLLKITCQIQP